MKLLVVFYSTYGHNYSMALAAAEGAKEAGIDVEIKRVPETMTPDVVEAMGATEAQAAFAHIPIATTNDLAEHDGIIFAAPTRFGMMAAQMKAFLDTTGSLWAKRALVGKVGSVMSSSATQHGGQEATILSFHTVLLHHGMIIVGLPYTFAGQSVMTEISGGSPYGASVISGKDESRLPSANELAGARFQGKHVAEIVKKLNK